MPYLVVTAQWSCTSEMVKTILAFDVTIAALAACRIQASQRAGPLQRPVVLKWLIKAIWVNTWWAYYNPGIKWPVIKWSMSKLLRVNS